MAEISLESLSLGDSLLVTPSENQIYEDSDGDVIMGRSSNLSTPSSTKRLTDRYLAHTPKRPSPLKSAHSLDDYQEDVSMVDVSDSRQPHSPAISALFNPTALGARVATAHSSPSLSKVKLQTYSADEGDSLLAELDQDTTVSTTDISLDADASAMDSPSVLKHRELHRPKTSSTLSRYVISSDEDTTTATDDSQDISELASSVQNSPSVYVTPWNKQPIQLHLHQHHYYSPQHQHQQYSHDHYDDNSVILPAPWSQQAQPKAPTPYLISSYLQLLFNAATSGIAIYILVSAILTVRHDINLKMEEYAYEFTMEVKNCAKSYMENQCGSTSRPPALEEDCIRWELCKNRDPTTRAGKASVSAETLGIILNSLIEPIGSKAMVVFALAFVAWAFASNFIFGFVRAKSYYGWHEDHQQMTPALPQATPSHHQLPPPQDWSSGYELSPSKH